MDEVWILGCYEASEPFYLNSEDWKTTFNLWKIQN